MTEPAADWVGSNEKLEALRQRLRAYALYRGLGERADDVVQEVLIVLLKKYPHLSWQEVIRISFSILRLKLHEAKRVRSTEGLPAELVDEHQSVEEVIIDSERAGGRRARLIRALSTLPERTREVFAMRLRGLKTSEIARTLDLSEAHVEVRLFRARKQLMHALSEQHQKPAALGPTKTREARPVQSRKGRTQASGGSGGGRTKPPTESPVGFPEDPASGPDRMRSLSPTDIEAIKRARPSEPRPADLQDSSGDWVETSVFGPPHVALGSMFMIQVFAHLPEQENVVSTQAAELDDEAVRLMRQSLALRIPPETPLAFALSMPTLETDNTLTSVVWRRPFVNVTFAVTVPARRDLGPALGTLTVLAAGVPVGRILFKVRVVAAPDVSREGSVLSEEAKRFTLAFVSHAAKDRTEVLKRVQMLRLAGIEYFQDVLNLEPGDRWEKELYKHIDECDLFLLFWSSAAKASEWVMKEVRYALARKGQDQDAPPAIHPVIIEGPPIVPPPPELQHLHFNDKLIYFMTPGQS